MKEMSAEGWRLAHVTSVTQPGGDIMLVSRIYLFWERAIASNWPRDSRAVMARIYALFARPTYDRRIV